MTDHIAIDRRRLVRCLDRLRGAGAPGGTEVTTIQVIAAYMGGFLSNRGVPASASWNAQFGKYLRAHAGELGIRQTAADQRIVINGDATSTSRWALGMRDD